MAHIKVTTDECGRDLMVIHVDGEFFGSFYGCEAEFWVGSLLKKLGHTYEEVEGNPYEREED